MSKFFKRNSAHVKAQKEGKERDNNVCAICGRHCETGQGHHVIPLSEGGPATTRNIVTMCDQCHKEYHSGKLKVDIGMF